MNNQTPSPMAIALVDLDDTLFQTLRKCPADMPQSQLTPMAWGVDGQPISYATPQQMSFVGWLHDHTVMIPVTGRSSHALLRTPLRFRDAVVAHGGGILRRGIDGEWAHCPHWHETMRARIAPHLALLNSIRDRIVNIEAPRAGISVRTQIVHEADQPLYLVIKHQDAATGDDHAMHTACTSAAEAHDELANWTVHMNGNNVAFMPPGLGKAHAVRDILPQMRAAYPELPVIGIGDSLTDAAFMQLCDFAMMPTHSQIATRLFAQ